MVDQTNIDYDQPKNSLFRRIQANSDSTAVETYNNEDTNTIKTTKRSHALQIKTNNKNTTEIHVSHPIPKQNHK